MIILFPIKKSLTRFAPEASCEQDVILHCTILCVSLTFVLLSKIKSMACGIAGAIAVKHSIAALREPGKLMISVLFRTPHAALKTYRKC